MFADISIQGYRGIRQAKVEGLNLINIFFGKNNCGKSSLLEAIFLLSGPSNPTLPIVLNSIRGLSERTLRNFALEFYRPDFHNEILLEATGENARSLKISLIKLENSSVDLDSIVPGESSAPSVLYGFATKFSVGDGSIAYESSVVIDDADTSKGNQNIDTRYDEPLIARFVSSRTPFKIDIDNFSGVLENKNEQEFVDILRIVDPRIIDIQYVGDEFLVDIGGERRFPMNVMGDGFLKVFNLVLSIYSSSDGILIVDELDNGIHYSIMPGLWRAVIAACRRLNVQLYASTHSLDLLKGLVNACESDKDGCQDLVSAYKLVRRPDDEVVSIHYSAQDLAFSLKQEIEVR